MTFGDGRCEQQNSVEKANHRRTRRRRAGCIGHAILYYYKRDTS